MSNVEVILCNSINSLLTTHLFYTSTLDYWSTKEAKREYDMIIVLGENIHKLIVTYGS